MTHRNQLTNHLEQKLEIKLTMCDDFKICDNSLYSRLKVLPDTWLWRTSGLTIGLNRLFTLWIITLQTGKN